MSRTLVPCCARLAVVSSLCKNENKPGYGMGSDDLGGSRAAPALLSSGLGDTK